VTVTKRKESWMPVIRTLITDFDNTLYDWAGFHIPAFTAMLDTLVVESGIPRAQLIGEFKMIHQKHGTSEYAFSISELPSLQKKHPSQKLGEIYANAIEAYRASREKTLTPYPGVIDALKLVRASGCMIVVYTESMAFYSNYRIRFLGLDGLIDYLYSPKDHDIPYGLTKEQIRRYPASNYELKNTVHSHTPPGVLKPSARVLLSIMADVGANVEDTLYVGDSLLKDILMAQRAGVQHAWAKYGEAHMRQDLDYDLLRAVTHWTDEMVQRERELRAADVEPRTTLHESFSEVFKYFEFGPAQKLRIEKQLSNEA
jgi:phosphoglycolate phosphatase